MRTSVRIPLLRSLTQALKLFLHNEQTQTNKSREKNKCKNSDKFNHGQFPPAGSNQNQDLILSRLSNFRHQTVAMFCVGEVLFFACA